MSLQDYSWVLNHPAEDPPTPGDLQIETSCRLYVKFDDPQEGVVTLMHSLDADARAITVESPQAGVMYMIGDFHAEQSFKYADGVEYFRIYKGMPNGDRILIAEGGA